MIKKTPPTTNFKNNAFSRRDKENRLFASQSTIDGVVIPHKPITKASTQTPLFTQNKFSHPNGIDPKDIDLIKKFDEENKHYNIYQEFQESDLSTQRQIVEAVKDVIRLKAENEQNKIKEDNLKRKLEQKNQELEQKTQELQQARQELEEKNQKLEQTNQKLEQKTQELEQAHRRGEFLTQQVQELKTEFYELSQPSSASKK